MARFVIVPQWQGSPSSRAMQLIDGAQAIAGDLPRAACTIVEIPYEAGESVETGIHRFSALARVRALTEQALAEHDHGDTVVVIGGDCGIAVPSVERAAGRHANLAVIWFDAHPDLHTPDSSSSGAFSGMALRAVLGDVPAPLGLEPGTVVAERVMLAGARDYDPAEEEIVTTIGIAVRDANDIADAEALAEAIAATGAEAVYVHVDLDVLDPANIAGVTAPVPFGVSGAELVAAIAAVRARLPLAGASITGFAPATPTAAVDDLGTILRIVGALA
ncbi:arginase family protein [Microbacterium sp. ASV49]|uniref:Arginase family protein n=1 Tax=Microbacterium candidum TaxID=3041922 RepID=A0ABT7N186_9MICO|nr:arginase family protein [Microbacterium sp. ASV49]MDL9980430.1 arginase family protein [Microbacterium sp. ASV49]